MGNVGPLGLALARQGQLEVADAGIAGTKSIIDIADQPLQQGLRLKRPVAGDLNGSVEPTQNRFGLGIAVA